MLAIDHPGYSRRTRWTLLPAKGILRKKLFRRPEISLQSLADRTWQIAPGRTVVACPAYFLPGQLERVTGAAYTDDPQREMIGGFEIKIPPVILPRFRGHPEKGEYAGRSPHGQKSKTHIHEGIQG